MPKVIQAIYENGVFKPVGKVDLQEHQQVEIVLSEMSSVTQRTQGILKGNDALTLQVMTDLGIHVIATNDSDFERVDAITAYKT